MTIAERSDAELLSRARDGDCDAFGLLFSRHRSAGLRLARSYRSTDPEDLVSEAFERVIGALRRGSGPAEAFRPYLFVTIRRLAGDRAARGADAPLDDLPEALAAFSDTSADELTDRRFAVQAFATLPDRLQNVLWHTAIEGQRPREVARAIGMPANTVSVMAHRARENLRQSYLQAHLGGSCPEPCGVPRARLGRYVRGTLTRRHRVQVDAHLDGCKDCRALADELGDVNQTLARAVVPVFAVAGSDVAAEAAAATSGAAAAGAASASGGAAALGTAGGIGVATVAKVAAGIAAVVGLVALSPIDVVDRDDDSSDEVEVAGAQSGTDDPSRRGDNSTTTGDTTGSTDGEATSSSGSANPGDAGSSPGDGTGDTAVSGGAGAPADVDLDLGEDGSVDAGVSVSPSPGVGAGAEVGTSPEQGVEVAASWQVGALGRGTLSVVVTNPSDGTVASGGVVVDLSPGARASTLSGTSCRASDPGLVGAVVSLLDSLTCSLGALGAGDEAALDLPLTVLGPGQTATIRVVDGEAELAFTTVALAP